LTLEQVLEIRHPVADARERGVDRDKGRRGDDAADQGVVAAGHRVLDRVRDHEDHDEIDWTHLSKLALPGGPQQEQHDYVDDRGAEDDLPPGSR